MAAVTLASRELRNKATGIDIYVPRHETISGTLGGTVLYHVIVVTRLFYFKTPGKHKESDIVQFMIPQKYTAFEELYNKLSQKFPSVIFSALPKKALYVSEQVVNDRQHVMEDVLEQIARTPKLACSTYLLEFLGAHNKTGTSLESEDSSDLLDVQGLKQEDQADDANDDVDLFAAEKKPSETLKEQLEDEEDDLFSLAKSATCPDPVGPTPSNSIFSVDNQDDDEDIGDLFIPAGAMQKKQVAIETEDNSGLLNIEDDLDKLLKAPSKPPKPPKPAHRQKPVPAPRNKPELKPKPVPKPRFEETTGNDDLFRPDMKAREEEKAKEEKELFVPRKESLRKPSHDEESLDDIFKPSSKSLFPDDDDNDLFNPTGVGKVDLTDMTADDISSYIQQNAEATEGSLDLF
ncbi:HCLS1-binding protein 3 [Nematostella vectensis]|uniref:HCLS1-binding protein 3 n=1 Tax=Nematostella vectensis TaxID=45351 RepID=UPI0020775D80|nr:HCLS1-binding protein 3 [Nematostella vectensis]